MKIWINYKTLFATWKITRSIKVHKNILLWLAIFYFNGVYNFSCDNFFWLTNISAFGDTSTTRTWRFTVFMLTLWVWECFPLVYCVRILLGSYFPFSMRTIYYNTLPVYNVQLSNLTDKSIPMWYCLVS